MGVLEVSEPAGFERVGQPAPVNKLLTIRGYHRLASTRLLRYHGTFGRSPIEF